MACKDCGSTVELAHWPVDCVRNLRGILLQLVASLTLAEHMGDVATCVRVTLNRLGMEIDWADLDELALALGKMGVTTLHGTKMHVD